MEDLQSTLQSILSDPEQMARVSALAESLGLKPPETAPRSAGDQPANAPPDDARSDAAPDLTRMMGLLAASGGGAEAQVLNALRPTLSGEGQHRVDRALRAAKLSRLAAQFLSKGRDGHG